MRSIAGQRIGGWGRLLCLLAVAALVGSAGCGQHRFERGYHDWNKVQVQFYAPAGAVVTVADRISGDIQADRGHQVSTYGANGHRLEHEPEEFAVFNLAPGEYEFKYNSAGGWPAVSVYGRLDVYGAGFFDMPGAKKFLRRSFIPIALPSPATADIQPAGDDLFPYQSATHRLRINQHDMERLAAGDMITKVVFLADLQDAKERLDTIVGQLVVMDRKMERINKLYRQAKYDFLENPKSERFIKYEQQRQELRQKMDGLEQTKRRLSALLDADQVLTRREMLVLATDEILPAHVDPVAAAEELGHVVLVMRVGGRHLHWADATGEAAAFNR